MNRYTPRPFHQLFPLGIVLVMACIAIKFPYWQIFVVFFVSIVVAMITSVWIAWAGKMREEGDYWFWVGDSIKQLKKAEPEIWEALGFTSPPEKAKIEVVHKPTQEQPYYSIQFADVPISPALLQTFAEGILSGRKTLSETQWCGTGKPFGSTKFRQFQDWMLSKELISPVNPAASTQGYILTVRGRDWLMQYASEGVRSDIKAQIAGVGNT